MWDYLANWHSKYASKTHGTPQFFPWHRAFLLQLENTLRSLDARFATVFVPYWSFSTDWRRPAASPIFSEDGRFDFNVIPSWTGDCRFKRVYPSPHCVIRNYDRNDVDPLPSSDAIAKIIVKQSTYPRFKEAIEYGPHAAIHNSFGGSSGDLSAMYSPNDHLFFMLHASQDRLWYLWQNIGGREDKYDGSKSVKLAGYQYTPDHMINQKDDPSTCVTYQDYSGDSVLTLSALRARLSRAGAEDAVVNTLDDVSACLPPPLSDTWVKMNGLDPVKVREIEAEFADILMTSTTAKQCAKTTNTTNTTKVDGTVSTGNDNTSQSVTVTRTYNTSIPAWAVALLAEAVSIVVLVVCLGFLYLRSRA